MTFLFFNNIIKALSIFNVSLSENGHFTSNNLFSEWQEHCNIPSGNAPKNEFSLYKNNPQLFTLKFLCPWFLWNFVYWVIAFFSLSVSRFKVGNCRFFVFVFVFVFVIVLVIVDSLHINSISDVDGLLIHFWYSYASRFHMMPY